MRHVVTIPLVIMQPFRINKFQRICIRVQIRIQSARKPKGVTGEVPSCTRVIISEVIIMQPGLFIIILAGKPHIQTEGGSVPVRVLVGGGGPERITVPAPYDNLTRVGHGARGTEMVSMNRVHGRSRGCDCQG